MCPGTIYRSYLYIPLVIAVIYFTLQQKKEKQQEAHQNHKGYLGMTQEVEGMVQIKRGAMLAPDISHEAIIVLVHDRPEI